MEKNIKIVLWIIATCLLVITASLFIKKIEIKDVKNTYVKFEDININDRENGICAGMYKEAFDWGVAQYKIDWQTFWWSREHMILSENQKAVMWYEYWKNDVMSY